MSTYNDVPIVECPTCGKTFQVEDYYEMGEGDTFDCRHCEAECKIAIVDTRVYWTVEKVTK